MLLVSFKMIHNLCLKFRLGISSKNVRLTIPLLTVFTVFLQYFQNNHFVNPLSTNVGYIRHGLYRKAKPSCNVQFELEIIIFGLTRRNWILLYGQAKKNSKVSLSSEILSQKVKKMQKLDKIHFFEILTVF